MTIGPNILILPPQNPMHVAEESATLDVLTGGNYMLGLGLGYRQPEFDAFGIPLSERAPRFNEALRLMKRLWTEDKVTHQGRFYTVNDAGIGVKPIRAGGPPLYIAGQADVSVRRAARIGDAWLIVNSSGLKQDHSADEDLPRGAGGIRTDRHRFPDHGGMLCRRPSRHRARGMPGAVAIQIQRLRRLGAGGPQKTETPFEEFARDKFIIGDKVSVKEEIARYHEILGVNHFIMRCQWPGLPVERTLASIKRLGDGGRP
jgi:alkanesulfonate monooxygenase SsuD/methylene tetrahydromethanopterin reductase-like flavin-dependent oxidoreductase (luciferase family)